MGSKEIYQKQIISIRERIAKERERKSYDNQKIQEQINRAISVSSKASYRRQKVDRAAQHDRAIQGLQKQLETAKMNLAKCR